MSGSHTETLKDYIIGEAVAELLKLHASLTTRLLLAHLSKMAAVERDTEKSQAIQLALKEISASQAAYAGDLTPSAPPSVAVPDSTNKTH